MKKMTIKSSSLSNCGTPLQLCNCLDFFFSGCTHVETRNYFYRALTLRHTTGLLSHSRALQQKHHIQNLAVIRAAFPYLDYDFFRM